MDVQEQDCWDPGLLSVEPQPLMLFFYLNFKAVSPLVVAYYGLYPPSTAEQQKQLVIKTQLLHYSVLLVIQDTENGSKLSYF